MKHDKFVKCPECKRSIKIQPNKSGIVTCSGKTCKEKGHHMFRIRKGRIVERQVGAHG